MQQFRTSKKIVIIDRRAKREIKKFPEKVRKELGSAIRSLRKVGFLREPTGKRIDSVLFEIRINYGGQFRSLYAYLAHPKIVVLSAFQKKTQKTPKQEIWKAKQRLQTYLH